MFWFLMLVTLALVFAPIRRAAFAHWIIVLPVVGGLAFGLNFAMNAVASGAPPIVLLLIPLLAAGMLAGEFHNCRSGKPRDRDDRRR